jgi:hypothetical protein
LPSDRTLLRAASCRHCRCSRCTCPHSLLWCQRCEILSSPSAMTRVCHVLSVCVTCCLCVSRAVCVCHVLSACVTCCLRVSRAVCVCHVLSVIFRLRFHHPVAKTRSSQVTPTVTDDFRAILLV